jgi:hypothetical protein
MTRSRRYRPNTSLEHSHSGLEDGVRGIAHSGVDVSLLRPGKLTRPIRRVGEVVRTCLVERHSACAIDGVWLLAAMDRDGIEPRLPIESKLEG